MSQCFTPRIKVAVAPGFVNRRYGMFIHFDADSRGECNDCGSQGTIMHLLLTRTNGGVDLCVGCFGALALACKLAAGKLRLQDPLACSSVDRE